MPNAKAYINWSSGKDAALALFKTNQEGLLTVDRLVTSVNQEHERVTMHGLRNELLVHQAASIGLPLQLIELPENPSMEDYGRIMNGTVSELAKAGYGHSVFGDIFLEDLRAYREAQLSAFEINARFPLWKQDTTALLHEFLDLGFTTCEIL